MPFVDDVEIIRCVDGHVVSGLPRILRWQFWEMVDHFKLEIFLANDDLRVGPAGGCNIRGSDNSCSNSSGRF